MPGAWISMRRVSSAFTGPAPSMGSPRALTTRPISASPTGTVWMRPVARTDEPSSMAAISSPSPRMTAPMDSSSRFRARPTVPPSNSRSSFTAQSGRPETRAMPSPTSRTRPTWVTSRSGVKPSRFLRRTAVMSVVSMFRSAMVGVFPLVPLWSSGAGGQGFAELGQAVADRTVDDLVADADHHAADHCRVDDHADVDLAAGGVLEGGGEPVLLLLGQVDGRADLGHLAA